MPYDAPPTEPPRLNTPGHIAQRLGVPPHRVAHVLATRHHIRPSALAGRTRLYDAKALAHVRHELSAMDARRDARQEVQL